MDFDSKSTNNYHPADCEYYPCAACNKLYKLGSSICPHCGAAVESVDRIMVSDSNGKPIWIPTSSLDAWKKGQSMRQEDIDQRKADLLEKLKENTPALRQGAVPDPHSKGVISPDPMTDYARRLEKEIAGLRAEYAAKSKTSSDLIAQQHLQIENMALRHQRSHFIIFAIAVAFCMIFAFVYTFTTGSSNAGYDDGYSAGYEDGYAQGYIDCDDNPLTHEDCIGYYNGQESAFEELYAEYEEKKNEAYAQGYGDALYDYGIEP